MSKKRGTYKIQTYNINHVNATEAFISAIDELYSEALKDFARLGNSITYNPDKLFQLKDYKLLNNKANQILEKLSRDIDAVISKGTKSQWLYANTKNDDFIDYLFDTTKINKSVLSKYKSTNLDALDSFQTRKINGLELSDRIWSYVSPMKAQMELGLDIALGEGKSAQRLAAELKQYLVDSDKLFRRVRDKHGNLVISKNAAAFNPGTGKYRSSYKNALRLARSEINLAYRNSDQLRWNNLDFIIGYKVSLSNNHTLNGVPFVDICDDLQGLYPKSFKFSGWHVLCRCVMSPVLQKPDDFDTDELQSLKAAINGENYSGFTGNTIKTVPSNFNTWVKDNAERSKGWKSQPYFIRDNFKNGVISGGLKLDI